MGSCRVDRGIPQDQENVVRIMVEFQIQCGFKFDFYVFSVWGSGARLEGLESNVMLYGH